MLCTFAGPTGVLHPCVLARQLGLERGQQMEDRASRQPPPLRLVGADRVPASFILVEDERRSARIFQRHERAQRGVSVLLDHALAELPDITVAVGLKHRDDVVHSRAVCQVQDHATTTPQDTTGLPEKLLIEAESTVVEAGLGEVRRVVVVGPPVGDPLTPFAELCLADRHLRDAGHDRILRDEVGSVASLEAQQVP